MKLEEGRYDDCDCAVWGSWSSCSCVGGERGEIIFCFENSMNSSVVSNLKDMFSFFSVPYPPRSIFLVLF
jgi:hypothetical protein